MDDDVQGDWEDVQIELGLKKDREHARKPTKLMGIGAKLCALCTEKPKAAVPIPPVTEWDPSAVNAKIGRNEPCLCGSGKKFKKCCWAKGQGSAP